MAGEGAAEAAETEVLTLPDIHDEVVAALQQGGFHSAAAVIAADQAALTALGLDDETIQAVLEAARAVVDEAAAQAAEAGEPGTEG